MFLVGIDKNNAVFVVPKTWRKSAKEVYWPPQGVKDVEALIKACALPALDYEAFECKWTQFSADNYQSAVEFQKLKISQVDSSDCESGRRILTQPNVLDFDAVENEFFSPSNYTASVSDSLKLLSSHHEQTQNAFQVESVLNKDFRNNGSAPAVMQLNGNCQTNRSTLHNACRSTPAEVHLDSGSDSEIRRITALETSRSTSDKPPSKLYSDSQPVNNALLESIKIDLAIVKINQERQTSLMEMVLAKLQEKESAVGHDLLPTFPMETREKFEEFNMSLAKKDVRAQMVNKLKQIGGKTARDAVRHAAAYAIAPALASQYTWHGLRGKHTLKTTLFGVCFLEAFTDTNMTEHDVGVIIGDFLRHVTDKFKKQH